MSKPVSMVRDPESTGKLLQAEALSRLRREWAIIAGIGALSVIGGYLALGRVWDAGHARVWFLLAAAVLIYELSFLWHHLPENHPSDHPSQIYPTLGPGNRLSLLRALLMAGMAGFLFSPWPEGWLAWVPGVLYTVAAIIDAFDGLVARRAGIVTRLGAALDLEYDALGILIAPLLAIWYGQIPLWYLLVSLARYLFVIELWFRKRRGLPTRDLTPSGLRRQMAALTMAAVAVALWPVLPPVPLWIATTGFMIPFMAGFIRDWLVTSRQLDPESPGYIRTIELSMRLTTRWLPLLTRIVALVGVAGLALVMMTDFHGLHIVLVVMLALIIIGWAGRSAAVVLTFFSGVLVRLGYGLDVLMITLLCVGTLIMLFGTGPFSLWRPENRLWNWPPVEES